MSAYSEHDIGKIKLVIWDLDDTFWMGTLSDANSDITIVEKNVDLIKRLTDVGIVNSICSKNDWETVEKVLEDNRIAEYFVFPSVDWTPKGQRIKNMLDSMGLRPVNALFLDDNHLNIEEVEYFCPGIMTAGPEMIEAVATGLEKANLKADVTHKRLKQYKILEEKRHQAEAFTSNEEFLRSCNIQVDIHRDCLDEAERIHELVMRSNQLNFTKVRSNLNEIYDILQDVECDCGTVWVKDKFGDYGMVGFYAIRNNNALHFLFSCRTIGMGIEQYVYNALNRPHISVVGDVISSLDNCDSPNWINCTNGNVSEEAAKVSIKEKHSVLFKGPCDLLRIFNFINNDELIDTEFTYINETTGVSVEGNNHTSEIVASLVLSKTEKETILNEIPFSAPDYFETKMFSSQYKYVFLSTLHDGHLAVYSKKDNPQAKFTFGEAKFPMTDPTNWEMYVNKKVYTGNFDFTREYLKWFSENYVFCGVPTEDEILNNIKQIFAALPKSTTLVLLLGVETAYKKNDNPAYDGVEQIYARNNAVLRSFAENNFRVRIIDFNKYIKTQTDFHDNLNHFIMPVYYKMAQDIVAILNEGTNAEIQVVSESKVLFEYKIQKLKRLPLMKEIIKLKKKIIEYMRRRKNY